MYSCNTETVNCLFSRIFAFTFSFKSTVTKEVRTFRSSSYTLTPPSSTNRHNFLTLPSPNAPSPYTSTIYLWISAGRTVSAFKNLIDFTSKDSGILDYNVPLWWRERGKGGYDTVLCNTRVPLWHTQEVQASPARPLRAISYQFLECSWNVMAHAQKPDFAFRRNGRVHLNRWWCRFNWLWQPRCAHQRAAIVLSLVSTLQLGNFTSRREEAGKKEWWAWNCRTESSTCVLLKHIRKREINCVRKWNLHTQLTYIPWVGWRVGSRLQFPKDDVSFSYMLVIVH
jgi:hypothetical protein